MLDMARRDVLPVTAAYTARRKTEADLLAIPAMTEDSEKLRKILANLYDRINRLEYTISEAEKTTGTSRQAQFYKENVLTAMNHLREVADTAEKVVPSDLWPFPTYASLLFGV